MNWVEGLWSLKNDEANNKESFVLVTILEIRGSSPRETGAKMVITKNKNFDTIGGGALEFKVINIARALLLAKQIKQHSQSFNLGKDLKQCCGGIVNVLFEIFHASDFNIVIFGAGHIGRSLVKILEDIDCQIHWFDSRADQFPENNVSHSKKTIMDKPEVAVESCPKNSYFLVMTHDHALDQQLCEAILSRGDSRYCGLIGSLTKSLKFKQRLVKKGFSEIELKQLSCPMGLSSISVKKPMEIAVSITAKLLELQEISNDFDSTSR